MAELSYRKANLVLERGGTHASEGQVRDLQRDLRCLGYLRKGIDGQFGLGTERAVKALQHDLLNNIGRSTRDDGHEAPVCVHDYNKGRVFEVSGQVDQLMVECISDLLDEPRFPPLPMAEDPVAENRKIVAQISALESNEVPIPFMLAILKQESGLKHFNVPRPGDQDRYIVIGLDTNASEKHVITSRGYGAGQYTLFHHPPSIDEVKDFMLDVGKNLQKAIGELREKLDHFVNGPTSGTRADDRIAEIGTGPLEICKYEAGDPRYLSDCKNCAKDAGSQPIVEGVTPFYEGSRGVYRPTQYYRKASYESVPIRKNIGCDWPYAARRYNGSGINSYHYQLRILRNLRTL